MIDITETILRESPILSAQMPFASLGSAFDSDEAAALTSLKVGETKAYDNFGALGRFMPELERFLGELGNDAASANAAASAVDRFVRDCLAGLEAETAWVTVRASNPTPAFDIPRWHPDGHYYEPYEDEPRKIVLTLKGPGTLFNLLSPAERAIWEDVFFKTQEDPDHQTLVSAVVPTVNASQATLQEAYLYITGADYAAIHSEPPIHEDRYFMSIVPGTVAQIANLRARWNVRDSTYA